MMFLATVPRWADKSVLRPSRRLDRRDFIRLSVALGFMGMVPMPAEALMHGAGGSVTRIRIPITTPRAALDPVHAYDVSTFHLLRCAGEYLCDVRSGGPELTPCLATHWWSRDEHRIWTFDIREGVTFHNGNMLTASDVASSLNRLVQAGAETGESNPLQAYVADQGAIAVDEFTLEIHLTCPQPLFPCLVSSVNSTALILLRGDAGLSDTRAVGTGLFKLASYDPNAGASFVRNNQYWMTDQWTASISQLGRIDFEFRSGFELNCIAYRSKTTTVRNYR